MRKLVIGIFSVMGIIMATTALADAELNKCLQENAGKANRYQICYGQIEGRAVQQAKDSFNKRLEQNRAEFRESLNNNQRTLIKLNTPQGGVVETPQTQQQQPAASGTPTPQSTGTIIQQEKKDNEPSTNIQFY